LVLLCSLPPLYPLPSIECIYEVKKVTFCNLCDRLSGKKVQWLSRGTLANLLMRRTALTTNRNHCRWHRGNINRGKFAKLHIHVKKNAIRFLCSL
jgi:hypothetical protein